MARRGTVSSQATLVVGLFVRIYTPIKVLVVSYFGVLETAPRPVPGLNSRNGIFVAEEGLIEVVDAGVEGGNIGAHFLANFG